MHFSHSLVLAFIASAVAQSSAIDDKVAQIPTCAKTCIDDAILEAGCASIDDHVCQCGEARGTITASAGPCVAMACEPSDLSKTLSLANEICLLAGDEDTAPTGSTTGGGSEPTTTTDDGAPETTAEPTATNTNSDDETTAVPTATNTDNGDETTAAPTTTGTEVETETEAPSETTNVPVETTSTTEEPTQTTDTNGEETGGAGGGDDESSAVPAAVWNYGVMAAGAGVAAIAFM